MIEVWPLIAFLFTEPEMDEKAWRKVMKPAAAAAAGRDRATSSRRSEPFDAATLEAGLRELIERDGLSASKVLQPIRVAITGSTISPGIFESLETLGRDRVGRADRCRPRPHAEEGDRDQGERFSANRANASAPRFCRLRWRWLKSRYRHG